MSADEMKRSAAVLSWQYTTQCSY